VPTGIEGMVRVAMARTLIVEELKSKNDKGGSMTGKRAQKKALLKKKITTAALEVFLAEGFDNATMSQIAKKAEVGLGTAYNYFESKADLFYIVMQETFDLEFDGDFSEFDFDQSVEDILIQFMLDRFKIIGQMDKGQILELFRVMFGSFTQDSAMAKRLMELDFKTMEEISRLIMKLIEVGKLPADFDVEACIQLAFSAFLMALGVYIFYEDMTYDVAMESLKNNMRFMLKGNV